MSDTAKRRSFAPRLFPISITPFLREWPTAFM